MKTPFPGIDPFLEAQGYWPDFHATFSTYLRDAIGDLLPDQYMVRIEERTYFVEHDPTSVRLIRPDVAIEHSPGLPSYRGGRAALEVEPITIPIPILEEIRETFIEILHRPDRSLVAVIELLSPDNKVEPGFGQYVAKRDALLRGPVHVIELDFLVGGRRLPMGRPLPIGDAYALVARGDRRPDCEVYAWSIRRPLPAIWLPLLAPDPDLRLDLAEVYATAFRRGRYARSVDDSTPLAIPLGLDDRSWAEGWGREAG